MNTTQVMQSYNKLQEAEQELRDRLQTFVEETAKHQIGARIKNFNGSHEMIVKSRHARVSHGVIQITYGGRRIKKDGTESAWSDTNWENYKVL